jgi:hypothetical protein
MPLLHLVGAGLAFVTLALYAASRSPLGRLLPAGESPGFAWLREHAPALAGAALACLGVVAVVDFLSTRARDAGRVPSRRADVVAAILVLTSVFAVVGALRAGRSEALALAHAALQATILVRVLVAPLGDAGERPPMRFLDLPEPRPLVLVAGAFGLGAVPLLLDPGLRRLGQHVELDSLVERALARVLPALLSGTTAAWAALVLLGLLAVVKAASRRLAPASPLATALDRLPFILAGGAATAAFVASLAPAIAWELSALDLEGAMPPLVLLVAAAAAALGHSAFGALARAAPPGALTSRAGALALALATVPALPALERVRRPVRPSTWGRLLLGGLAASLALAAAVLFGGLFNPWFTVLSYLKAFLFKTAIVAAAAVGVLGWDHVTAARACGRAPTASGAAHARPWRVAAVVLASVPLTLVPFAALEYFPEVKAAVLQFSELAMVDTAYARPLAVLPGLRGWIRLGQSPTRDSAVDPWPQPWALERVAPSMLPRDFSLVVVVVDALRGDAFHSAGYHRNLTPFLDRWARDEAVSFRRAYSQGSGTFAALPFLVAGRSRFDLYGPGLHRENVFFQLARAEGIRHVVAVHEFTPSALFPPDVRVIGPGRRPPGANHRSASADEVLGWAREAIAALEPRERFFVYAHLLDMHDDLWKKADGVDLGDAPRDLYDNNLSYVDRALARFVGWLRHVGRYDRTVIVLTADHGEQFWEHGASLHGHTLYEEELRVPLVLRARGVRGRFEDVPVVTADLAPTLVELAGYAPRPPYDDARMGLSLVPLLRGRDAGRYLHRDVVGRASFKRTYFLYRDWRFKLTWSAERDLVQLFDVATDPGERHNLVRARSALAAELERELLGYLARVEGRTYRRLLSP